MADGDPIWDKELATKASVVRQMETLGAVKLNPHRKRAGFTAEQRERIEQPPRPEAHDG